MFDKIITINYHPKLIKILIEFSFLGTFAANIIAPFISIFLLYSYIPHIFSYLIIGLNIILFILRLLYSKKLLKSMDFDDTLKTQKDLKIIFVLILLTSLQYIFIFWICIAYYVSDLYILIIAVMIISLAAGAISTLSSIFTAFLIYVVFTIVPLFCFMLYIGGTAFYTFSFIVFVFSNIILSAGYRQFNILKNTVSFEDTFRTIYEKSSDGVIIVKNNSFKDCNEAVIKMIGCDTKEDFMKLNIISFSPEFQPDGRESSEKAFEMMKIAQDNGYNNFEWLNKRFNGEEFWVEMVLTKIHLNNENLLHVVMRDISERKKKDILLLELNSTLEEKIEYAIKEMRKKDELLQNQHSLAQMGEMLSMIAHQWRQPLSAISSTNSAIALKAHLNKLDIKTAIELSDKITFYIKHLSDTIDDFRDFFKPDKGMSVTSYDELMGSILGIVEVSLDEKNIELIQELQCKDKIKTYSNEMKQVILNLIKNAEDILVEKNVLNPYIKVRTYKINNEFIFEVSDNGGGIHADIIKKVFNPYFSTKTKKNGTGLGLYMSKKIVEDHCGGKLSVYNSSVGATFEIKLGDTNA